MIDFRVADLISRTSHRTVASKKSQSARSSIEENKGSRKGASARSRATIAIHAGVTQSSEPPRLEIYALAVSLGILGCIDKPESSIVLRDPHRRYAIERSTADVVAEDKARRDRLGSNAKQGKQQKN